MPIFINSFYQNQRKEETGEQRKIIINLETSIFDDTIYHQK